VLALCDSNAMAYNQPGDPIHEEAAGLSRVLAGLVNEFKAKQVQSAKKSFSRSSAKPNSSVAALLERRNYEDLLSSLKPTAATLLVVPGTLLDHWEVSSVPWSQSKEGWALISPGVFVSRNKLSFMSIWRTSQRRFP
jgi:hypothetical protein